MNQLTAAITAVGAYLPDFVLTNKLLETMVDTNELRHSYEGKDDVLAGRPNFIRFLRRNA